MTVPSSTEPFDIPKALDRVWHAGLLHKLKSYGSSNHIFSLLLSFLSNRHFLVVLNDKSSKEYSVNVGVPPGFIPSPTILVLLSLLNCIRNVILSLLLKLPPRKLENWFAPQTFFHLSLLCISVNLPYSLAWYTVFMPGLILIAATWNF